MKTCTKCGDTKPLDQYYKHKRSPDGYRATCNICRRAYKATRRDRIKQATPAWFEREIVAALYLVSQSMPAHQVDHIIPINGKLVSGLHCWDNLQIIPATENNRKNNSFTPA